LLDAELLAEVFICMTRGQDALLIEEQGAQTQGPSVVTIDLAKLELPVVRASAQEMAAHEDALSDLDQSSGGKTIWRAAASPVA
jgi:DNA polymerase-3 subunit epsilon